MANPEHLEILKRGVKVWNKWRDEHKEVVPDLNGADLSLADIRLANLSRAKLSSATLRSADLKSADLRSTDLSGAVLSGAELLGAGLLGATLRGARFAGANLSFAHLNDADLRGAYINNTDFKGARLSGADFTDVVLGFASFTDNDLSQVKGLDAIKHEYPSSIGIDTIYKSKGNIPEVFLRGCGVPEDFITYMRSLTARPIQFYRSFISSSSKDQKFADRLYADLQNKGVRCWLATEDLKIGDRIRVGIDEAIRLHDKLLLVLSKHSVASDWVEQEVETALERERREKRTVLFPIRLDDAVMKVESGWPALVRNTRNIGDFRKWKNHDSYQRAFDIILRDLKAEA
jgi:hypothetical protein